jgi:hypothetical protein
MANIKTYVLSTSEIDDAEQAVISITSQLPIQELQKNTIGIIACHYEFILSGVAEAVCDALPFTVVGTITSAQATQEVIGSLELVISVLTSDSVTFAPVLTDSLAEKPLEVIDSAYQQAKELGGIADQPDLILIHAPFMPINSGDDYLNEINKISNDTPLFGTLAVDDTLDFRYCFSIFDGKSYNDRMVITLIKGVTPKFYSANISPNQIIGEPALITKSSGQMLIEVNDRPIGQYFTSLGLAQAAENQYAMSSLPFLLDYDDGTPPVSRVFIALTPDGSAILNGSAPEGLELKIGAFDKEEVLNTTGIAVDDAVANSQLDSEQSFMLAYSCIARSMSLGADQLIELEQVTKQVDNKLPFMMAYSGGEYCPLGMYDGKSANRFHNNALIICAF